MFQVSNFLFNKMYNNFIVYISRNSATLYYIIKGRDKHKYGTPFKNHIIRTLLNGMSTHITDEVSLLIHVQISSFTIFFFVHINQFE